MRKPWHWEFAWQPGSHSSWWMGAGVELDGVTSAPSWCCSTPFRPVCSAAAEHLWDWRFLTSSPLFPTQNLYFNDHARLLAVPQTQCEHPRPAFVYAMAHYLGCSTPTLFSSHSGQLQSCTFPHCSFIQSFYLIGISLFWELLETYSPDTASNVVSVLMFCIYVDQVVNNLKAGTGRSVNLAGTQ